MNRSIVPLGVAVLLALAPDSRAAPPFELVDGDRVVLIGGTMIERDQTYGYLETRLTRRYPERSIIFRNLGWSGDTVGGVSRARFGTPAEGFKHLVDHVVALKPTVVVLGYGANEAFEGPAGLPAFLGGLDTLLAAIEPTRARLVFLAPNRQEDLGPPLPDPTRHNADLALYRDALKDVAGKRGAAFVDLYDLLPNNRQSDRDKGFVGPRLTGNGIHFTGFGYWFMAAVVEEALFGDLDRVVAGSGGGGNPGKVTVEPLFATVVQDVEATPDGVRFRLLDATLPGPHGTDGMRVSFGRTVKVSNLKPGRYALKGDGKPLATGRGGPYSSDAAWKSGVPIGLGPEYDQVEALRLAINAKNELYFYRWRPQNETYLFGFRKYEQGRNAAEIVEFDPLIAAKEAEIARLRVPVPHVYELTREGEVGR